MCGRYEPGPWSGRYDWLPCECAGLCLCFLDSMTPPADPPIDEVTPIVVRESAPLCVAKVFHESAPLCVVAVPSPRETDNLSLPFANYPQVDNSGWDLNAVFRACPEYRPSCLRAFAAGRKKGRSRRSRKLNRRENSSLERKVVDLLRVAAPAAPPVLRDVEFPMQRSVQVLTIRRGYDGGTISTANGAPTAGFIAPTLATLPDYTDFTNLFDAYRIDCVKATFTPIQQNSLSFAARFYSVIDYDDSNPLASLGAALEYDSVMVSTIDNTSCVTRTFRPKFAVAAYSGVFTSFAQSSRNQWVDVASATVPFYGLKWIIEPDSAVKAVYRLDVVVCLRLKAVR